MISIVGIGDFSSKIANKHILYPQYTVYNINTSKTNEKCFLLPFLKNSEEYENKCPQNISSFIDDSNDEISIFLDGSESISGVILKFLENLKSRKINIYYIRSDLELMGNLEKIQDKICFNILQEYARSGLFNKFVIFDRIKLEQTLNNISILEIEEELGKLVSSTIHYVNVYTNIKPILSNSLDLSELGRIQTYGLSEINSPTINWFYDLQNIEEIIYYFAINSNTLKKERNLLQTIKNQVKEKQKENVKVLFSIFETSYEQNFVYCVGRTKFIQQQSRS
jgi:hypothetical protein